MKYSIIYADPPWDGTYLFTRDRVIGKKPYYPLMKTDDIKRMPVRDLSAENSTLLLWVTDSYIPDALDVIKAWGFEYKTIAFTRVKETSTGKDFYGVGRWTRKNPEICLLATKGNPKRMSAGVRQLQRHQVREHSRKPDEIRGEIVKLLGDLPRIELFARQKFDGWDVFGNEVEGSIELP
jgi:N6-adenosine-specific RNA methylase IME4